MEVLVKMSFGEVKPNSENIDWDPRVCQLKFPGRSQDAEQEVGLLLVGSYV